MAITSLSIEQDNVVNGSNLMPIHSPLIFLIDANYSGSPPNSINCEIQDDSGTALVTVQCVPFADLNFTVRRFSFMAHNILQAFMDDFDDFEQPENTFMPVPNINKVFKLVFKDPDAAAADVETTITAVHGVRQFGDQPNLSDQFNNDNEKIYIQEGLPGYVYFYNDNENNVINIGSPARTVTFNVTDAGGALSDAQVSINGLSETTGIDGRASFELQDGTYAWSISKSGFITRTGNLTVSGSDISINITLTAVSPVTFTLRGWTADALVSIHEDQDGATTPIFEQRTDLNFEVSPTLFPGTYYVSVAARTCDENYGSTRVEPITVEGSTTLIITSEPPLPTWEGTNSKGRPIITFVVVDGNGIPIEGAEVRRDDANFFGNCFLAELLTNTSGTVQQTIQNRVTYLFNFNQTNASASPRSYQVKKAGFTTVTGTQPATFTDLTINITLNQI